MSSLVTMKALLSSADGDHKEETIIKQLRELMPLPSHQPYRQKMSILAAVEIYDEIIAFVDTRRLRQLSVVVQLHALIRRRRRLVCKCDKNAMNPSVCEKAQWLKCNHNILWVIIVNANLWKAHPFSFEWIRHPIRSHHTRLCSTVSDKFKSKHKI